MNTYQTSTGERLKKSTIDYRIREAKKKKLQQQRDEIGYNVCTRCFQNDCVPLDCSHRISVKECQENGMAELAYDLDNIDIIGRRHHVEKDKLKVQWTKTS